MPRVELRDLRHPVSCQNNHYLHILILIHICTAANPCYAANVTLMTPTMPAYFTYEVDPDTIFESGFSLHLTCTPGPASEYRQWQETGNEIEMLTRK